MTYESRADVGGQEGYGPVTPEPEGDFFHAGWERMALAITLAMGATGTWSIDESRSVRECLTDYHSLSYYQLWIKGLIALLIRHGLVAEDEIAAGRMLHVARSVKRVLQAADAPAVLAKGSPTVRPASSAARFAVGDRVKTLATALDHHTRLPAYARGKVGRITAVYGPHVFADALAQGLGEQPQWLYNVVFTARELWGGECDETSTVSIDAWEPYLEPSDPVFREPWEAQAFAMAVMLHERHLFTWGEWADALGAQIASAPEQPYYQHWLMTLERLVAAKGASSSEELNRFQRAWQHAAHRTPHGQSIDLQSEDF